MNNIRRCVNAVGFAKPKCVNRRKITQITFKF